MGGDVGAGELELSREAGAGDVGRAGAIGGGDRRVGQVGDQGDKRERRGPAGDDGGDHAGQALPLASASLRPDASSSR